MSRFIQIVEVGPRDGLQNEKTVLEPAVRADFVQRLEAAGARRIEAVSFVHPKYVPQMAGAEEVMAALPRTEGRSRIGLVLNGKGYDRALGTAVDEVNVAMSATDGFGLKNQGLSVDQQVQMLSDIIAGRAYSNGKLGKLWSVRRVLTQEERPADAAPDRLHYHVIAGDQAAQSGACSVEEFRAWARFEVVSQGSGRWMKAE